MNDSPVLSVRQAARRFGDVQALAGIDLEVRAGEVVALLGPNGAGKSTLIRCITTLERLDSGTLQVCGHDVAEDGAAARGCIGYAGQESALDKVLTGREFLRFQAGLVHLPKREGRERADALLRRFGLQDAADRTTEGYSGGMKRRLDLAASLMHGPKLLILDEPSTGLDYDARRALWSLLSELRAEGTALLLATHDFEEADALSDRAVLMHHGKVLGQGTPDALRGALGDWVLGAALSEHPREGDRARLLELMAPAGGAPMPPAPRSAEVAVAVRGKREDGTDWADWLRAHADAEGVDLAAVSLRRPTLQDAYLAATRDEAAAEEVTV